MKNDEQVFRVSNLFYYILRGRRLIIIFAIIGFIAGIILSGVAYLRGEMSKEYRITSSIAIIAQTRSGNYASNGSNPGSDDVKLAQEITDSAIYILRSDRTLRAAIEAAGLTGVSVADIKKNLQLSQYNETQIIEITLYWRSNTEGIRVLEAINQVSGEVLLETLKIGNVSVVNTPDAHYIVGGSVSMSTWILGAFGGAAIAMGICILKLFLAPVLTHVKDVERFYTMKVLYVSAAWLCNAVHSRSNRRRLLPPGFLRDHHHGGIHILRARPVRRRNLRRGQVQGNRRQRVY